MTAPRDKDFEIERIDLDDSSTEEDEEEEIEEDVEIPWHPRARPDGSITIFQERKEVTGGSFFDHKYDVFDPNEGKTAQDLANEGTGDDEDASLQHEQSVTTRSSRPDESSKAAESGEGGESGQPNKETAGKSPLEFSFDADARFLRRILKQGTKKARAFFPPAITDLFQPPGMKQRPTLAAILEQAQKHILQKAKEKEALKKKKAKKHRGIAGGFVYSSSGSDSGSDQEDDNKESPEDRQGANDGAPQDPMVAEGGAAKETDAVSMAMNGGDEDEENEEDEAEPIDVLFDVLSDHWAMLEGVYRHYCFLNSRNPFAMSSSSWLCLCKDARLDEVLLEDSVSKAKGPHEQQSVARGLTQWIDKGRESATVTRQKVSGAKSSMATMATMGPLPPTKDKMSPPRESPLKIGRKADPLNGNEMDREAVMALEVLFFTATGSDEICPNDNDDDIDDDEEEEEEEKKGKHTVGNPMIAKKENRATERDTLIKPETLNRKKEKKKSRRKKVPRRKALLLPFSKHDMKRLEFVMALMALARAKQRQRRRNDRSSVASSLGHTFQLTSPLQAAMHRGRAKEEYLTSLFISPTEQRKARLAEDLEHTEPGSFDEYILVLERDVFARLITCRRKENDMFREEVLYREELDKLFSEHVKSLRAVFKMHRLPKMSAGDDRKQLPYANYTVLMKMSGILGDNLLSASTVQGAFLESQMIQAKDCITADRCLDFVSFLETIVRLAVALHGPW